MRQRNVDLISGRSAVLLLRSTWQQQSEMTSARPAESNHGLDEEEESCLLGESTTLLLATPHVSRSRTHEWAFSQRKGSVASPFRGELVLVSDEQYHRRLRAALDCSARARRSFCGLV